MNYILRDIEKFLIEAVNKSPLTEGLLLFSPTLRERDNYFSTAKACVVLSDKADKELFAIQLFRELKQKIDLDNFVLSSSVIAFISAQNFTKIEVVFLPISSLLSDILSADIRITNISQSVIIDKHNLIAELLNTNDWQEKKINLLVDRFLVAAYDFYNYSTKKDFFRAYNNFIRLIEIIGQTADFIAPYQRRELTNSLLLKTLLSYRQRPTSESFSHTLTLEHFKTFFPLIVEQFLALLSQLAEDLTITIDTIRIKNFLVNLEDKFYPLPNFRDIAKIPNYCEKRTIVKEGVVFRSAMPEFSFPDIFHKVAEKYNIRTIIDLREEDFFQYYRLEPFDLKDYNLVRIPIAYTQVDKTIGFVQDRSFYKNLYYGHLEFYSKEIGRAINAINTAIDKGAVLVHCTSGKDRTGIIVAFLQKIAGVSDACIIEDYLASFSDTKRQYVEYLLELMEKHYGGWQNYLTQKAGVSPSIIIQLQNKLRG